jgi:hypothetical protein
VQIFTRSSAQLLEAVLKDSFHSLDRVRAICVNFQRGQQSLTPQLTPATMASHPSWQAFLLPGRHNKSVRPTRPTIGRDSADMGVFFRKVSERWCDRTGSGETMSSKA